MNNQTSSLKTWIWIAAIIAVAGIAYFWWSGSQSGAASTLLQTSPADTLSAQTNAQSSLLSSIKIDSKFFQDPVFNSLQDYSVGVPQQNIGRPNPFAPLPGDITATSTTR